MSPHDSPTEKQPSPAKYSRQAVKENPRNGNLWVTIFALWVPLALTLILVFLAQEGQHARDLDAHWVLHSVEVKDQVDHLHNLIEDVETCERGYLLTGDISYLTGYEKALQEIPGQNQSLALLVADNSQQVAAAANLQSLIADKLSVTAQSVSLAQQNKNFDAIQLMKNGQGKLLMDEIRSQVDAMEAEEDRLFIARENAFTSRVTAQKDLMSGLVLADIALIVGLTLLMRRLQQSREKAGTEQAEAREEHAIRASEVRYRRLFETAQDGILILDAESGQVVDANPFMKDLLGYSQEEFLGKKLWEIGPFKGEAASKIAFAELQHKDRIRYEGLPLETKEGRRVEVEFISNAFLVDNHRLIQCNIRDTTERKKAEARTEQANIRTDEANTRTDQANTRTEQAEAHGEEVVRASELRYRRLFETAQDGILILDAESGQVVDANPFMKDLLGYSQEEFLGKKLWEIGPFKGEAASKIAFAELQHNDRIRYEGLPLETRDGLRVEVEFISNAFLVDNNHLIQCNIRDITERKKSEQHLALLNTCISNLNDIVMITEAEPIVEEGRRIIFVNEAFTRITGYSSAETLGKTPHFLQGKKTDPHILAEIHQALEERKPIRRQVVNYARDGTEFWVDIDIVPIFDASGKCAHFAAVQRDITERKQTEEARRTGEERYRTLFDYAPDGILISNSKNTYIDANTSICRMLGYTRDELIGRHVSDIVAISEMPHMGEALNLIEAKSDHHQEWHFRRKDGSTFEVDMIATLMPDGNLLAMIRDITERKKNEVRFHQLVNSNAQGVVFWNINGGITGANDSFLQIVGYTREDLEAGRIDWMAMTPSEYSHLDRRALDEIAAKGTSALYEKEFIRKDGSRVPILLGSAGFKDNPDEGFAFVLDLTERKKLEHQFLRAQRMESIGTLAGGVAHDLNNILAPIVMSIDLLKISATDPQARSILETIEVSAKRGTDIVRQVLSFARGLEGERIEVQPNHLLKDLENIIKDTFPKNIRLHFTIPNDTWAILGDPTQVHQILLNLCVNARDAMPGGGILSINVENAILDEHYTAMNIQAKVGRHVKISVTDSGTGMPPDVVDKIFEPFFTTKELHKGTGLGLSTVMAIVKSHTGTINVYSEPGKGTTFKVYLPAMEMSSGARKQQSEQASLPRGNGEKVLVVDDEASILAITSQTLQAFGYRVLTATDGAEAVALYAQHRHEIAVVLTDMSMPILDGAATIRALMRINPGVKIIAASGLMANGGLAKFSGEGVKHFLTKPYSAGTLLTVLRAILDQA